MEFDLYAHSVFEFSNTITWWPLTALILTVEHDELAVSPPPSRWTLNDKLGGHRKVSLLFYSFVLGARIWRIWLGALTGVHKLNAR